MTPPDTLRWIATKRDGGALSDEDVTALVAAYVDGLVDDAQLAALLMAGVINGFSTAEAIAFTEAFVRSGDVVDLSHLSGPTVDKHSTGGVGDTTTFVVGPILAACGLQVAKLSGRGLGHTGGTLDKLEAIPGLRVELGADELRDQVEDVGLAVAAATADIVPADKRIYALRDVTGTVASRGLIAASVMSKKIAGGADTIVLDVKVGDGAFMRDLDDAVALAELCVEIGQAHGRRTAALVTDMSQPLGPAVGNAVEVAHAVDVLAGRAGGRLRTVSLELAAAALSLTGTGGADPLARATAALDGGDALDRFRRMVVAQGGDGRVCDAPWDVMERAPVRRAVAAPADGVVASIGARGVGELAGRLGAGRQRAGDPVDPAVGVVLAVEVGDAVTAGQPLATLHARDDGAADAAASRLVELVTLAPVGADVTVPELLVERVGA
ncbi:MAG: thymidine phosphorylase [Actinomycetes bacterium]